ncbi:MAG: LpxI family protein [Boseongicola sp. SB0664_bin_43]|uniref:LpxI family protein n=1 Tax=Boseongicola sp. SB0664_bin_43 TaxID=2604844 RepID=A0A6B0Y4Z1_9RHOB|nr:LpxI family protein [Boseongicola sp. SB0664_bin_43]MYK31830.1 LpxI family protein [Boseongicola sp. SB0670_bin_30]
MLALVAGNGGLPGHLARTIPVQPVLARIDGTSPEIGTELTFRLDRIVSFMDALKARGVTELCFAGAARRPEFDPGEAEIRSQHYVDRIVAALEKGDDGALTILLQIFEAEGFVIRAAHELAPDLLPAPGVLTRKQPAPGDIKDAARADAALKAVGFADIGQACVVHQGQVIAIETSYGTDWMLASLDRRPDGSGGIFAKAPKPGQDRRVDLPTIGPGTATCVADAGLGGIVIEAGGVMVLDREESVQVADDAGIFLWVRQS